MAEQNEKKEKKGFAAWWAGLAKGAKIGISAGAAVVLAGAVVGTVLGVKSCSGGGSGEKLTSISVTSFFFSEEVTEKTIDFTTNPTNINLENAKAKFEFTRTDTFQFSCNLKDKKITGKVLNTSGDISDTITFSITLNNATTTTTFDAQNHE